MGKYIRRGELYYAYLEPVIGSEQGGERPVVILQNNRGNRYSPTVIVAPLTTKLVKRTLPVHVKVTAAGLRSTSLILLEQIRTIDKQRLRQYIGEVTVEEMREYIMSHLARHKVPKYIEFTDAFPMNAAGKVLKYKMREEAVRKLNLET